MDTSKVLAPLLNELDNIKLDNLMLHNEFQSVVYALRNFRSSLSFGVTIHTVASEESENKKDYDFENFTDAINFILNGINLSSGHIILMLEKGTHLITKDIVYGNIGGVSIPVYQVNHMHVTIMSDLGNDINDTIISLDKDVTIEKNWSTIFRVEEGRLNISNVTFDPKHAGNTNIDGKNLYFCRYSSTYSFVYKFKMIGNDSHVAFLIDPNTEIGTMYCEFEHIYHAFFCIRRGFVTNYKNKYTECYSPCRIYGAGVVIDGFATETDCAKEAQISHVSSNVRYYEKNVINLEGGYISNAKTPLTMLNSSGDTDNRPEFPDKANGFIYNDTEAGYPVIWMGDKYMKLNISEE